MVQVPQKAIDIIADLNERLFEAEYELEEQKRAVSKYRHYLAADANSETVLDVRGSIQNLRGKQKTVDDLREKLNKAIDNIWKL